MTSSVSDQQFAFGRRGEFPLFRKMAWEDWQDLKAAKIPGITWAPGRHGIRYTWDAMLALHPYLNEPIPWALVPRPEPEALPCWDLHERYWPKLRNYQREDAIWIAHRAYCVNGNVMRLGKTRELLVAAELAGCKKVLITPPAKARLGWADEIIEVIGDRVLLLYGRAANKARWRGERFYLYDSDAIDAIAEAKYVIVNYDLLIPHLTGDMRGKLYHPADLPGWARHLRNHYDWDVVIFDEIHRVRDSSAFKKRNRRPTKREIARWMSERIPRAWGATGTIMPTYIKDLWGPFDLVTFGLWGMGWNPEEKIAVPMPFTFQDRYCDAHKDEWGRVDTGESNVEELESRRQMITIERKRSEVLPDMPEKIRIVERYELDCKLPPFRAGDGTIDRSARSSWISRAMAAALRAKLPLVLDSFKEELQEGGKMIVYTQRIKSAELVYAELEKMIAKRQNAGLRRKNARVWLAHGSRGNNETRYAMAKQFREAQSPAAFVATIDCMQEAYDLSTAQSVHYLELHNSPGAMLQSEDRPNKPGVVTAGLNIIYHVISESIDEHIAQLLIPKIQLRERLASEEGAVALARISREFTVEEAIDDFLKRFEQEAAELEGL